MHVTTEALFTRPGSARGCLPGKVPDARLRVIYELMTFGPTSGNSLAQCMNPGSNQAEVHAAPVR